MSLIVRLLASDILNNPANLIPSIVIQVGIPFLVVSCVGVAAGFVGGYFKPPQGTSKTTITSESLTCTCRHDHEEARSHGQRVFASKQRHLVAQYHGHYCRGCWHCHHDECHWRGSFSVA